MADLWGLWGRLRESLWFVPSILVLGAILLAVGMVELSTLVDDRALARWPRVFGVGPDGARSMLSAIAGSMITVAGVTFSITIVAVTQASTQYSPRILRNFMRDRANQGVLGTFVGIYAYCLIVLRTIREGEGADFVPAIAVLVGVLLALVGVAVLIFFVHHIATTLQASEIVARITRDTRRVLERVYPTSVVNPPEGAERIGADPVGAGAWHPVPAPRTGYVQRYSRAALLELAEDHDLLIRVQVPTGDFVVDGRPVAWFMRHPLARDVAAPRARSVEEVARAAAAKWVIGTSRSLDHDPAFGFRQLVDVALKALSPGINDSTTALTCIDYLGALLMQVADCQAEVGARDRRGWWRVVTVEPGFDKLLELAVEEIRQHARGNVAVLEGLLRMLGGVAAVTRDPGRTRALIRQVELIGASAETTVGTVHDLGRLQRLAASTIEHAAEDGPPISS